MTTSTRTYLSPFDAALMTGFDKSGAQRINRFGVGFGGQGYWGNEHFPTEEQAREAFDKRLADLRKIYGTPGRLQWTGQYREETNPIAGTLIAAIRFVPLKKNGKPGVRIQTVHLYRIEVTPEREQQIREALRQPNLS